MLGYIKEKDLSHDDVIAMIDEHLQRVIEPAEVEEPSEEDIQVEELENSTTNVQTTENDKIEQISKSQKEQMEELSVYIKSKKEEIDKYIAKIKRKEPPTGDISKEALTVNQKIKANWFEVDV